MNVPDEEKYTYRVEWSPEDRSHIARCLEFPSLAAHGKDTQAALNEIKFVVAETLAWMQENGEVVPEPFSLKRFKGNLSLRISPELHKALSIRSAEQGVSINKYILARLSTLL
ncbi:MAG: toxin-antitoxin system HicB family antitoxin [Spirochaetota bacterium]